jgi:pimeloyl-ACP methyl ester carboxylesterase
MPRTFRDPATAARYFAAYDAALAAWPIPVEPTEVPTRYGVTRVNVCGAAGGTPLVLLPGGGATSTQWGAVVAALGRNARVYAVDTIGDAGRSVAGDRPVRTAADLLDWLGAVLDGLGVGRADLCGHSYGGWLALNQALHAPDRVRRLVLLDPSTCFAGMRPGYRLRAVPLFARPSAARVRAFVTWETRGIQPDPTWLSLMALSGEFPRSPIVLPRRPAPDRLRAARTPTLVLLAERSRCHDIDRVGRTARRLMPDVATVVLPGAAHHNLPMVGADRCAEEMVRFLS